MNSPILKTRFMLVGMFESYWSKEKVLSEFEEAEALVKTYGGNVFAVATQNKTRFDHATFIGTGKAQEVAQTIQDEKIDIVVVNANVKPGQLYTLKKIFDRINPSILVWDRMDLILHIFSKHANTAEAKLQIKLAFMRHMGPRIYGMGFELSQQAGGIGTKGIGETNTELMHRHWKNEMRQVRNDLKKLESTRQIQMDRRRRTGLFSVSIVGYTNAGKTTLFNTLTKKNNLVEDALFATLDTSTGRIYMPNLKKEIYISDTIGFIKDLPHQLIDAFRSTLMETIQADVLLHVIDSSDPLLKDRIVSVENVLKEMDVEQKNKVYVFNKWDKSKFDKNVLLESFGQYHPQFVSAQSGLGSKELVVTIEKLINN